MVVKVSYIVTALAVVAILIGGAFALGQRWHGEIEEEGQSAAAEAAAQDSEPDPESENSDRELHEVVKVIDGDTITIKMGEKNETVRLIGIDTPETVDTRVEVQCFGKESSAKLKSLLTGKKVYLEMDEGEGERDKYRRLLAYVLRDDGLHINKYLIEEGYAYEYTYDSAYKYQDEFKDAEKEAKAGQKGLWAPDVCPKPEVKGSTSVKAEVTPEPASETQDGGVEPEKEEPEPDEPDIDTSKYTCSSNTYNCPSFKTHAEAQAVFEYCGGTEKDVHKLDRDKDGQVCESLP